MKIYLREITDQETELDFTQEDTWVKEAVACADEVMDDEASRPNSAPSRPVHANFSLRKVDDVVVISGRIDTSVQLVCSRCAAYYLYECHPNFSSLFCKDPVMAGVGHLERDERGRETGVGGRNSGHARHAHDSSRDDAVESGQDLDITYISEDFIDLASVLTEQIQLQIPFQPLCREECKGMCPQCGADMNSGRCACAKLVKANPFSVLSDLKAKSH